MMMMTEGGTWSIVPSSRFFGQHPHHFYITGANRPQKEAKKTPRKKKTPQDKALEMYRQKIPMAEIGRRLHVSASTVRSWKNRGNWDALLGWAPTKQGPPGNHNAVTHGLYSRYLPQETREIIDGMGDMAPADLLFIQIQIAAAAIMRAQKINFVADADDTDFYTVEKGPTGEKYRVLDAGEKQAAFMAAQARAQSELRGMIKQYEEMTHADWNTITAIQRARLDLMRAQLAASGAADAGERVVIVDDISHAGSDAGEDDQPVQSNHP